MHIPEGPDPISMLPAPQLSGPGLGKSLMEGAQNLGDFLVEAAGAALGKAVQGAVAVGGAAVTAAASVSAMASSAVAPFKPDFTPSNSPAGQEDRSPSHGMAKERSMEVASVSFEGLGNLSPPATPSMGVVQNQGRSV